MPGITHLESMASFVLIVTAVLLLVQGKLKDKLKNKSAR